MQPRHASFPAVPTWNPDSPPPTWRQQGPGSFSLDVRDGARSVPGSFSIPNGHAPQGYSLVSDAALASPQAAAQFQDPVKQAEGCGRAALSWLCALAVIGGFLLLGGVAASRIKRFPSVPLPPQVSRMIGGRGAHPPANIAIPVPTSSQRTRELCGFSFSEAGDPCDAGDDTDPFWKGYVDKHRAAVGGLWSGADTTTRVMVWQCLDSDFCAGVGDQARGLSASLYVAMLSKRIFFIRWRRHGQNVTSLFGKRAINWELPPALYEECGGAEWVSDNKEGDLMRHAQREDRCVAVTSNQPPELELAYHGHNVCSQLPWRLHPEHYVGCAMNFLFDFSSARQRLSQEVTVSTLSRPSQYVAVHLRFGDRVFTGHDDPDSSMVDRALRCATHAGRRLFDADATKWGIFFASDSARARALALELNRQSDGAPEVFVSTTTPIHGDFTKQQGWNLFWGEWGDQLYMSQARGIVQCMDMDRHCDVSGYSQLAGQVALMDSQQNVWVAMKEGCGQGGDITMNSWFDRASDFGHCTRYLSMLQEALSMHHNTSKARKTQIDKSILYKAENAPPLFAWETVDS